MAKVNIENNMKYINEQWIAEFNSLTQGLEFGYLTNSLLKPFIWEVNEKGELTAEKLMLSNKIWGINSLSPINFDNY